MCECPLTLKADSPNHPPAHDSSPPSGSPPTGGVRRRAARPKPSTMPRKRTGAKPLIETQGPQPDAALDDVRLTIGMIGAPHGVHGEVKLKLLTDQPKHLTSLTSVFLGESTTATTIRGLRFHQSGALLALEGYDSPEEVRALGGLSVRIAGSDARPLEPGEYFLFQLIGLKVERPNGEALGTVVDLMETGSHDVLVITPDAGSELLVPNHPEFVKVIDPENGRIVIEPPVYDS